MGAHDVEVLQVKSIDGYDHMRLQQVFKYRNRGRFDGLVEGRQRLISSQRRFNRSE